MSISPLQIRPSAPLRRTPAGLSRLNRPAALTRKHTGAKARSTGPESPSKSENFDEPDLAMAGSFLQYCATCERQMIVPNSSVLYCSESCRRKDARHSSSLSLFKPEYCSSTGPVSVGGNLEDIPAPVIVAARSPTTPSTTPNFFMPSECYESDSDSSEIEQLHKHESKAIQILRQIQPRAAMIKPTEAGSMTGRLQSSRVSSGIPSTAPSLSHTPTSISSSTVFFTHTPSARPLPPRHRPQSLSYSSKSVDLVLPIPHYTTAPSSFDHITASLKSAASPVLTPGLEHGNIEYSKKQMFPSSHSPGGSSLKDLFGSERPR